MAALACAVFMFGGRIFAQDTNVAIQGSHANADRSAETLLAHRVTFHVAGASLKQVLDSLSRSAHVFVQYEMAVLNAHPKHVTVNAADTPLSRIFEEILEGTGLTVTSDGVGGLLVTDTKVSADSLVASGTIHGRVVDSATGRGVSGATVKVAGTKLVAVSGDSGRFVLRNVPVGTQLVTAKAFGYRPKERTLTVSEGSQSLAFMVTSTPNVLSGVVTTATGLQERRAVGNDITVLNADSIMRVAPVTSVTDLLATRVPGLTVQRTSGLPGAPSRLRLRGIGGGLVSGAENTSNDPIVIVDGIRIYARQSSVRDLNLAPRKANGGDIVVDQAYPTASALDQIDPNSIETIEVFKGPSATSQWGADAGNGVIVITTKRGRAGPTQVRASLSGGITKMPGTYAAPGFYVFGRPLDESSPSHRCQVFPVDATPGVIKCVTIDSIIRFQAENTPRFSSFGTGGRQDASITVSGGAASTTYSLTGSVANELGYLRMPPLYRDLYKEQYGTAAPDWARRPNAYKSSGGNATVGLVPASGLQLILGASLSTSDQRQTSGQRTLASLSGTYLDTANFHSTPGGPGIAGTYVAPFLERGKSHDVTTSGNIAANWLRWAAVPIQVNGGVQTLERTDQLVFAHGLIRYAVDDTFGLYSIGHGRAMSTTMNAVGTLPLGRILKTAIGANLAKTSTEDFSGYQDTLAAGIPTPTDLRRSTQTSSSLTTAGWFFEPRFNLNSRFFATPGFRFDGGSAASHSAGHGGTGILAFFPKLNFAWIAVDREGERPLGGVLTLLRPRLGFGVAGVQPQPTWRQSFLTDTTSTQSATIGPGGLPGDGVILSTLGNPGLHPERSRDMEGGFDATLWDGRANIKATVFNKLRTDAIQQITTAPSVYGGKPFYVNVGKVRNTGVELTFDARLIETGSLAWGINGSLSSDRNKLVTLYGDAAEILLGGTGQLVQGYPLDGVWSRPILGYYDTNGDGRISLDEVAVADKPVYVGNAQPSVEIPFGTTISLWHGLMSVTAGFDYKGGVTQVNSGGAQLLSTLYADTGASLGLQAIAVAAQTCDVGGDCEHGHGTKYGFVQTVSVLRFNTLSVNYNIPDRVTRRLRVPHATIALQGSNLGLWSNYRGKDPDVNDTIIGEGLNDSGQAPLSRVWTLRIDLGN